MQEQEQDGYHFLGYYGVFYLFFALISLISFIPAVHQVIAPMVGLIFPIAQGNSPLKFFIIMTVMYWGMVLFYALVIQKKKLKF